MKAFKVIAYPICGVFQFYLATQFHRLWFAYVVIGIALIGLAILNLLTLMESTSSITSREERRNQP